MIMMLAGVVFRKSNDNVWRLSPFVMFRYRRWDCSKSKPTSENVVSVVAFHVFRCKVANAVVRLVTCGHEWTFLLSNMNPLGPKAFVVYTVPCKIWSYPSVVMFLMEYAAW